MSGENFKKITVAENKFEADLIAQTLQEEEIPCMIRSYHDTAYDGIFIPQRGGQQSWYLKSWRQRPTPSSLRSERIYRRKSTKRKFRTTLLKIP